MAAVPRPDGGPDGGIDPAEMTPGMRRRLVKECVLREEDVPEERVLGPALRVPDNVAVRERTRGVTDAGVPGLLILPSYYSAEEMDALEAALDASAQWDVETFTMRHMAHYGVVFDYESGQIMGGRETLPLPDALARLTTDRFVADGLVDEPLIHMLASRYAPGNGIGRHVDRSDVFGDVIVGVNLRVTTRFTLMRIEDEEVTHVTLQPGAVYVLTGPARFHYRHGITRRQSVYRRFRKGKPLDPPEPWRISLTFRNVWPDFVS